MSSRLAIDLGSSNTVAVLQGSDGPPRPLLFDGAELLPSAVYADPNGALVVGRDAERLARADPAALEPHPKRRIDEGTLLLGAHTVDVRDALAAVLAHVAGRGLADTDPPTTTALSCPAGWGAPRRNLLAEAAAQAGLKDVVLISEPVAAAAYFCAELNGALPPGAALAVVDVGGGTVDAAVVRQGDGLEVVAQAGLDLGGVDVDAALVDYVGTLVSVTAPEVWRALQHPATSAARRDRLVLWQEVRAAKETLSRTSVAPLHVPGYPNDLHLTREELEAATRSILTPIGRLAAQVVSAAGLTPDQLIAVFLVGGGSRIPLIARLLHTELGIAPTVVERPETVVAEGALWAIPNDGRADDPAPAPAKAHAHAPALARPVPRRRRPWLTPAVLIMALLCFLLPFATVSCGLPDGYGRAQPGGTTSYGGFTLVFGGSPDVPAEHVRPEPQWRSDRLPPQPLLIATLLSVIAGLGTAFAVRNPRRRRSGVAALCVAAVLLLLAGQQVVVELLATRIQGQSAMPTGRTPRDYVGTGAGFWLVLALLTATVAGNIVATLRRRKSVTVRIGS